jgi:hypothetical protein
MCTGTFTGLIYHISFPQFADVPIEPMICQGPGHGCACHDVGTQATRPHDDVAGQEAARRSNGQGVSPGVSLKNWGKDSNIDET